MAHPVPNEGDTVEVLMENETVEGTVVESRGNYAEVDVGDKTVETQHESVATDEETPYRLTSEDPEESVDSGEADPDHEEPDDGAENVEGAESLEPSEMTVSELEDAVADVETAETLEAALAKEEAGEDRATAKAAIEERLNEV